MVAPTYLRSLQALELAVREGSFAAAAESLGITPAAVGQRVKALEDYLGVELLVRGRAGIRPAPGLLAALPHLHQGFGELAQAARELELQRGHELHIAAASDFVELWLVPRLDAQPVDTYMSVSSGDPTGDDVDRSRHGLFSLIARRDRARLECRCDTFNRDHARCVIGDRRRVTADDPLDALSASADAPPPGCVI